MKSSNYFTIVVRAIHWQLREKKTVTRYFSKTIRFEFAGIVGNFNSLIRLWGNMKNQAQETNESHDHRPVTFNQYPVWFGLMKG